MGFKRILIFDLDETLIDSKHRTPNHPDGTLDLENYFKNRTRDNIFRDTLLPLADYFKKLDRSENYIVICTARTDSLDDRDYLAAKGLMAHKYYFRNPANDERTRKDYDLKARKINKLRGLRQFANLPVIMFDDAGPVIKKMREIGVTCLNAIKVNERLV